MSNPTVEERRQYLVWAYAHGSFATVVKTCDFLLHAKKPLDDHVLRTIYSGLVATYAQPFTRSYGTAKFSEELEQIVPEEHRTFHASIIDFRHKAFAHMDSCDFKADDPHIGNINQIRIYITKEHGKLYDTTVAFHVSISTADLCQLKQLSLALLKKSEYHTEKLRNKYIQKGRLASGRLSLEHRIGVPTLY